MANLNPILSPTQEDIVEAQEQATTRVRELVPSITGIEGPDQALIREILPDVDLASGADNAWNGTDREWSQQGLAADQFQATYDINSNNEAQDKVIAIYGVANPQSVVLTSEFILQDGTGATFYRVDIETLEVVEISDVILFNRPFVFGATEDGTIGQWPRNGGDDGLIVLAKVGEPLGNTLSTRERPESRLARGNGR